MTFLLFIIMLSGLVLRWSYITHLIDHPLVNLSVQSSAFDQFRFMELAKELIRYGWLGVIEEGHFSPTYSYLIAAIYKFVGPQMHYVFYLQTIMGIYAIYVLYKLGEVLFENRSIGLMAAFFMAFYGPLIFFEGALLRASLITYTSLIGAYFLIVAVKKEKRVYFLSSGMMFGLSHALTPGVLAYFICMGLGVVYRKHFKKSFISIILFSIGFLLVLGPLLMRHHLTNSYDTINSQNLSVFWIGNTHDSSGIGVWQSPLRLEYAQEAQGSIPKTFLIFLREIRQHPGEYVGLYLRKIRMYFNGYEIPGNFNYYHFQQMIPILRIGFLDFTIIFPLAVIGLIASFKRDHATRLIHLILLILCLGVIFYHVQGRYRLVSTPLFILFAAYGLWTIFSLLRQGRMLAVGSVMVALLVLGLVTQPHEKHIHKYFWTKIRGIDYVNMSMAYHRELINNGNILDKEGEALISKIISNFEVAYKISPEKAQGFRMDCLINIGLFQRLSAQYEASQHTLNRALALRLMEEQALKSSINRRYRTLVSQPQHYVYFEYF